MALPEKPLLRFTVVIKEGCCVEIEADRVEIYENGVPQFMKRGQIVAAFNSYEYFIEVPWQTPSN